MGKEEGVITKVLGDLGKFSAWQANEYRVKRYSLRFKCYGNVFIIPIHKTKASSTITINMTWTSSLRKIEEALVAVRVHVTVADCGGFP